MTFLFERLDVYQKALSLAERVPELTSRFPRGYGYLADHFKRASLSVALNIAEGNGRGTAADRRHFFLVARGSVQECVPVVELRRRKRLLAPDSCLQLRQELIIISKMLWGMIQHIDGPEAVSDDELDYTPGPSDPVF